MKHLTLKGIVKTIGKVERPSDGMEVVNLDILEPGYIDQWGDKKGIDTVYRVKLFNDAINKFPGNISEGDRVEICFYLNSKEYQRSNGDIDYNLYLNYKSIEKLTVKPVE